jgi:ADP-ribosylglycohydrolase
MKLALRATPGDYSNTICTAIAVGGDVDTTAAMTGAISGRFWGLMVFPKTWRYD